VEATPRRLHHAEGDEAEVASQRIRSGGSDPPLPSPCEGRRPAGPPYHGAPSPWRSRCPRRAAEGRVGVFLTAALPPSTLPGDDIARKRCMHCVPRTVRLSLSSTDGGPVQNRVSGRPLQGRRPRWWAETPCENGTRGGATCSIYRGRNGPALPWRCVCGDSMSAVRETCRRGCRQDVTSGRSPHVRGWDIAFAGGGSTAVSE
jgi:hypothetical protein